MTDLRFYCCDDYKQTVKAVALENRKTVSDLLREIIEKEIPPQDTRANLMAELEHINEALSKQGGSMTAEERHRLKKHRSIIKKKLEGESND